MTSASLNAVILAGNRPGGDPLAEAHGVAAKALVPVAGQPMLAHVLHSLIGHPAVGEILVMAQDPEVFEDDPVCGKLARDPHVTMAVSSSTIASSMDDLLASEGIGFPILITTADNVLLDRSMVAHFVSEAGGCDIAIAVVGRSTLMARFPESKRTWLKFRGGQYSGANLFHFGSKRAREILRYWAEVEQDRKKGWKILTIFGPWLLFLAITRMLSIDQLAARVGKKIGLDIRIVQMPQAEACIDVDKPADLEMVEKILAGRGS